MLMLVICRLSGVFPTFELGVGVCADPGKAECPFHPNQGFMSRDQELIGDVSGQFRPHFRGELRLVCQRTEN